MKIGIIVYSHSGNTLSVAEKLKEELLKAGHSVDLEKVKSVNEDPNAVKNIQLASNPDTSSYERIIFASPVNAFSLAAVMKTYLSQLQTLEGKTIDCFVTQQLKKAWMGGNHAIKQIQTICSSKGGKLGKTGNVHWSSIKREEQINDLVKSFTAL